jgi:predicted RNase H-like nuclease (RuvC/YqgF family)
LQKNIHSLNNDVQIHQSERQTLLQSIEKQAAEIVALKQDLSSQKQKCFDDIETISILRKQIDVLKHDRDEKVREISSLKSHLNKNESSVENQH